jgi:hypothetical protein
VLVPLLALTIFLATHHDRPNPGPDRLPPVNSAGLTGTIDVLVWNQQDAGRRGLHLSERDTPPLLNTDEIRVKMELNRPAYAYIIWIDTRGKPIPIYPWDQDWQRPAAEKPVQGLNLPEGAVDEGLKMDPQAPTGMETLVLLARDEPLPADFDVRAKLQGLPEQPSRGLELIVWFENGVRVPDGKSRGPMPRLKPSPLQQLHERLRTDLYPHTAWSRAVTFQMKGVPRPK